MTTKRTWVCSTLLEDPLISAFVGDRVFQNESLDGAAEFPFIVYGMGNASPDNSYFKGQRQYFTVYVYDEADPGVYDRIDEIVDLVIHTFEAAGDSPEYDILEARYLETSKDLDDPEIGALLRYIRFQLVQSKR